LTAIGSALKKIPLKNANSFSESKPDVPTPKGPLKLLAMKLGLSFLNNISIVS